MIWILNGRFAYSTFKFDALRDQTSREAAAETAKGFLCPTSVQILLLVTLLHREFLLTSLQRSPLDDTVVATRATSTKA